MEKKCISCKKELNVSFFNKSSSNKTGYQNWCRACQKIKYNEYRKANPEIINAKWKRYYERNREKMIKRTRDYENRQGLQVTKDKHSKYGKSKGRFLRYGITEEIYLKLREQQEQKCAMCNNLFGDSMVHIDHCHKTNKVRGILCVPCNLMLGIIERPNLLEQAQAYLRKTEK